MKRTFPVPAQHRTETRKAAAVQAAGPSETPSLLRKLDSRSLNGQKQTMSLLSSIRLVLSRPHPEAKPFLLGSAAVTAVSRYLGWRIGCPLLRRVGTASALFFGFCLYFFRDPKRTPPAKEGLVLAAADGRVVSVEKVAPPVELDMGDTPVWRVATFLSVLDVHVNRSPVAGTVSRVAYHPGKFLNASLDKASTENERNALSITLPDGRMVAVVQIAGLIARRIVCSVKAGDRLEAGERFGIIRFGSRTDVYLPPGVEPLVEAGQTMVGGETVLANLTS